MNRFECAIEFEAVIYANTFPISSRLLYERNHNWPFRFFTLNVLTYSEHSDQTQFMNLFRAIKSISSVGMWHYTRNDVPVPKSFRKRIYFSQWIFVGNKFDWRLAGVCTFFSSSLHSIWSANETKITKFLHFRRKIHILYCFCSSMPWMRWTEAKKKKSSIFAADWQMRGESVNVNTQGMNVVLLAKRTPHQSNSTSAIAKFE